MRVILAAAIIASLATPAFAQQSHVPQYGEKDKDKTPAQKAADKAAQDAYERSLGTIPDQGPSDPWGTMRSNNAPKTGATKTAKAAKARTGSAEAKPQ